MQLYYISGYTGFIGQHLSRYLGKGVVGVNLRNQAVPYFTKGAGVVHLAGKAHDLKKTSAAAAYFKINTAITKQMFNVFLASEATVFVFLSSIKALEGKSQKASAYSQSKYLAEQYIQSKPIPKGKRVYILRPSMVHGPGNKGNLNELFFVLKKGWPWPLAAFENKRSFIGVENLCFVIKALLENKSIPSGSYAVAEHKPLSTNTLVQWAGEALGTRVPMLKVPKGLVRLLAKAGDVLPLPLNSERLEKLTESAIVDHAPLFKVLEKPLPVPTKDGFIKTFNSFLHE